MRCFSWKSGELRDGLALMADEKLGQVIFLGEEGRGRRYEKVALGRRNPADVVNGRVLEAHPIKITLPAKEGMREKSFYVLEKPAHALDAVLVRVNTYGGYVRGGQGGWVIVAGTPEVLVSGYGAFGDAGRIGNWNDGILRMSRGDVLKICESRSEGVRWALWIGEDGTPRTATWQDWENLQAVSKAEAVIAEAEEKPEALPIAFGSMAAFTYSGSKVESGIKVSKGATGPVVALGEEGRGRVLAEVPIVGFTPGERLEVVAIAVLSQKEIAPRYSSDKPTIHRIYGLIESSRVEEDAALVRTCLPHACRTFGEVKALRGAPALIARGVRAGGIAGRADSAEESLWVLRSGEAVLIEERGRYGFSEVISNVSGKVSVTSWDSWEIADGLANPAAYIAKGKAPWGHAPAEWVGRVVKLVAWVQEYDSRSREYESELQETKEGELVSIGNGQIVLNLGWDGQRDRQLATINSGVWVRLDTEKVVVRADASAEQERDQAKADVARLRAEATAIFEAGHFACFKEDLRDRITQVARGREQVYADSDLLDISLASTEHLRGWAKRAEAILADACAADADAKALASRQEAGEILVDFGANHRRGGMTGNGDGWVIRPDGSFRERDSDTVRRHKSDGTYRWLRVEPEELALRWSCHHVGDVSGNSQFEVAKSPVGGCTSEQLAAVRTIEEEIGAPEGAFGLDPEINRINGERLAAIREVAGKILKKIPDFLGHYQVAGKNGITLEDGSYNLRANFAAPFADFCDGREAQVVRIAPAADGMVEFLAYDKYGQMNFAMRWRPLREDEIAEPESTLTSSPATEKKLTAEETAAAIALLKARFGGR